MRKEYNQFTKSDIPLDASLTSSSVTKAPEKKTTKPKINAIGSSKKSSSSTIKSNNKKTIKKGEIRKKISQSSVDLDDLEKLNEENIKTHRYRAKRNQVYVVILSVLLVLAISVIAIYLVLTNVEENAFLYIHGDVEAVYCIDGNEMSKFSTPANIQGYSIFEVDIGVNVKSAGKYKIQFAVKCYLNNELMDNVLAYYLNSTDFKYDNLTDFYVGKNDKVFEFNGGESLNLCKGIIIDEQYKNLVTKENFKMEVHTYFERVY